MIAIAATSEYLLLFRNTSWNKGLSPEEIQQNLDRFTADLGAQEVMILITGATGTNGMELIKLLASQGIGVRALVRSPDRAMAIAHLPGVELMIGDLRDHTSIETALSGVERAFLVTNSSEEAQSLQCRFVGTARHTGLQHIVNLSQLGADPASPVRFLRYHGEVENVSDAARCWPPALAG